MSARDAARDLAIYLGPFSVGRISPAGAAIIAQAEREADAEPSSYSGPFHYWDGGSCVHCGIDDHDIGSDGPCVPHEPVALALPPTPEEAAR